MKEGTRATANCRRLVGANLEKAQLAISSVELGGRRQLEAHTAAHPEPRRWVPATPISTVHALNISGLH